MKKLIKSHLLAGLMILGLLVTLGADGCSKRDKSEAGSPPGTRAPADSIEYERIGGIAGFQQRTVIERDGTVKMFDRGELNRTSKIGSDQIKQLENLLREQKFDALRANYGRPGQVADAMTERLTVQWKSGTKSVTVQTDTNDPPPAAFNEIVQRIQEVTKEMSSAVTAEGTIHRQGITTYQYGTHVLQAQGRTKYALTSKSVKLDDYVGKRVRVVGSPIDGYPLSGGPEYLEVSEVTEIK